MLRPLLVVLALVLAVGLGLRSSATPSPVSASAPADQFSSERAMSHLRTIAAKPHLVGSAADAYVEDYLVARLEALGYDVRVQDAVSVETRYTARGWPVVAASVHNVIARKAGASSEPGPARGSHAPNAALLLSAHYDSRELAPGASDDGYGTAALLETARALSASSPLPHDVMLLFTEGEEEGLLGAKAFVEHDPAAHDAGLVLNFDARGDAGPAFMFQTSAGASDLVEVLARSVPRVTANSLSAEIYRRLPNDTDLTVWLDAGYPGMNFANTGGFERYHQPTDTVANADAGTLQQHGSYALGLARAFASRDTIVRRTGTEQVYFDLGPIFVHYQARVVVPLALGALVLLVTVAIVGLRRGRFRGAGVLAGVAGGIVIPILAAAAGWLVTLAAKHTHDGALLRQVARADLKSALFAGCCLLGAGVAWIAWVRLARRFGPANVGIGAAAPGTVIAVILALALPGGSYLLAWPAVLASIAWALELRRGVEAVHTAAACIAVTMLVPLGLALGGTFGVSCAPVIAALAAFAASFAIVPILIVEDTRGLVAGLALIAAGLSASVYACSASPFDARYPQPDTLIYAIDADHDATSWITTDGALDGWTAKVMQGAQAVPASTLFTRAERTSMWRAPAEPAPYQKPRVDVLDTEPGSGRALHVRVTVPPDAEMVDVVVPAKLTSAMVSGESASLMPDGSFELYFYGPPPEGIDLVLRPSAAGPLPLHVVTQSRGWPSSAGARIEPRPAGSMARNNGDPLRASDMTLVSASFQL